MSLTSLPPECFNEVCVYLEVVDLFHLSVSSKALNEAATNDLLWNLLLCQRLWTVDPSDVLEEPTQVSGDDDDKQKEVDAPPATWQAKYRRLVEKEHEYQRYLNELKERDLHDWVDRHFIGELAPHWNGWERRYWSWNSRNSSFSAWLDDSMQTCMATFPLRRHSQVLRVSEEEQVELTRRTGNPVRTPRPHVFTLTHTTLDLMWACETPEQLQLWMDKINVTLHPLQFEGQTFQAPAKYRMETKNGTFQPTAIPERSPPPVALLIDPPAPMEEDEALGNGPSSSAGWGCVVM